MFTEESTILRKNESFLLDDLLDQRSFKEAALKRSAQISSQITSVTLGPNSSFCSEDPPENVDVPDSRSSSSSIIKKTSKNAKPKREVSVNKSPSSAITTSDLIAMQRKLKFQEEERRLNELIRKRMEERFIAEKIHNERIQKTIDTMKLEAERKHKAKMETIERQIEAVLKLEEQKEMVYQNQRLELTKNTRRIIEQKEKELRDNLKHLDDRFNKIEVGFYKMIAQCDPDMMPILNMYKKQFEDLTTQKNSNRSSLDCLKTVCAKAEEMCHNLLKHCKEFEAQSNARKAQKEADDRQAAENRRVIEERQAAEQAEQAKAQIQVAQVQPLQKPIEVSAVVPQNRAASQSETGRYYYELMQLLNTKQIATQQLTETRELEALRFALKLAVNNPVNMLNEENKSTLTEGFQKLHNLLSGQRIATPKGAVSITDHIEASDWTKLRIAEKLIDVCDKKFGSLFYIAALTVALWQKFPDFGKIFLAKLFKECPFLVPFKPPKLNGQSDIDFFQSWGYRMLEDKSEKDAIYQARTSRLAALMAAIWITTNRRDEQAQHPFGIDNGWKYFVNILNSQPDQMYLHILEKILEISGSTMHMTYGKQFVKLMILLKDQYLPSLRSVDIESQAAYQRLRDITIAKFFQENRFPPPKGKLMAGYW